MRLAIVSTPRSGNSWARSVLRDAYGLHEIAVHRPQDIPHDLPDDVILQLHWYRTPDFVARLTHDGFRVIVLARHPLDVLLSVLHFVRHEPETAHWLDGAAAIPPGLAAATPRSPAFMDYAMGRGAVALLGVSQAWWRDPQVLRLRYEDMVRDPSSAFGGLADALGPTRHGMNAALHAARLEIFQATPNRHGWQGRPGLWRELLPPLAAFRLYLRHQRVFLGLGYAVSPYFLSASRADANWRLLMKPPGAG